MAHEKKNKALAHDRLAEESPADPASPRSFAFLVAALLAGYALYPLFHGRAAAWGSLACAMAVLLAGWQAPAVFSIFTRWWLAFGSVLSRIVAPLSMAVVFYGVITTYGALLRLFRRDVLKRHRDPALQSYWVDRSATPYTDFERQF